MNVEMEDFSAPSRGPSAEDWIRINEEQQRHFDQANHGVCLEECDVVYVEVVDDKVTSSPQQVENEAMLPPDTKKHLPLPKIQLPPGSLLLRLAETVVSRRKYERDCQAALADWHEEYFEALDQKCSNTKMAFIRIRHTWAFFKATGWLVGLDTTGKLVAKLLGKIGSA